jgi:chromosome partitioning protein
MGLFSRRSRSEREHSNDSEDTMSANGGPPEPAPSLPSAAPPPEQGGTDEPAAPPPEQGGTDEPGGSPPERAVADEPAESPSAAPEPKADDSEASPPATPEPTAEEPAASPPVPPAEQPAGPPPATAEPTADEPAGSPPSTPDSPPAPERPPVNRATVEAERDDDDDVRMTAQQALGPSRAQAQGGAEDGKPERRAQVISFANQKGGVAKTTTTLNLAVAFSESGHDVLVIDLDPQGNLTMSQGIDPDKVDKSMYDVLVHREPIRDVIHSREVDVAVASIDLAGAEIAMSTQIGRERALEKGIAPIVDDYDFICIDTPPSLGLLTVNALTASDKVIVPVQCEYLSMRGLVQLQNTLEMIRENLNPGVVIEGILPTMLDSRTVHAKEAVEILEENFGELVFKSRIRKAIKFAEAPVRGSSVLKYDPSGNAANYYRELAKEVLTNGAS